jgi:hypothetical protein
VNNFIELYKRRKRCSFPLAQDGSLSDVIASAVFDLDATQTDSYVGSGTTWANLVTAPADGSAQTAYDFMFGNGSTSTTYPTFTGTPGDPAAYFLFDGGDYFRLQGSKPDFLDSLQKTTGGTSWWLAMTIQWVVNTGGLFGTSNASSAIGMNIRTGNDGSMTFRMRGDTNVTALATPTGLLTAGGNAVIIYSFNKDTSTLARWVNTTTASTSSFILNPTAADAVGPGEIFSRGDGNFNQANGARLYSCAMGNEYIDDTKAAAIISLLESRHGRDYTP